MKIFKILGILILLGIAVGGYFAYQYYDMYFEQNVPNELKTNLVQIPYLLTFIKNCLTNSTKSIQ